ncbi:MAG TPA: AAA family ATPase [Planosporangium sp.]|jgi:predicted ATPase|nr:AAA family ATPase [Planosporangium sp.]
MVTGGAVTGGTVTGGTANAGCVRTPPGPEHPSIFGRESEVFRLGAAWGAAVRGRPSLVLLAGKAGIGKTRVAAETALLARNTGGAVLWARCQEGERSLLLQPFVEAIGDHAAYLAPDVLRRLAGQRAATLAALIPRAASVFGPTPTIPMNRAVRRHLADQAVVGVLQALAAHEPVLLLLGDLHHAGSATVRLLRELTRGTGTRLLVVATVRTPQGDATLEALADAAVRLDVGPLSPAAVTRWAADAGSAEFAADLRDRTRGHPLFVLEALHALATGETAVPESLAAAVLARVRRVDEDTEHVLRAAAVLGVTVDRATLARLVDLPLEVAAGHCEVALSAGLLAPGDDGYEFTHDLVREVLYETTPEPARALHHRRAAELLEHLPEAMAAHATAVGDWVRAARGWLLAGEDAAHHQATEDAQALLARAVEAARRAGDATLATLAQARLRALGDGD